MGQIKTVSLKKTSSGDITLQAGATGQVVRLLGYTVQVAATGTVEWKSGSTSLSGAIALVTGDPLNVPVVANRDYPHLQTAAGEALVLSVSGASAGHATIEVLS